MNSTLFLNCSTGAVECFLVNATVLFVVQFFYRSSLSYHDPTSENTLYHCWWLNATEDNYLPIECKGWSGHVEYVSTCGKCWHENCLENMINCVYFKVLFLCDMHPCVLGANFVLFSLCACYGHLAYIWWACVHACWCRLYICAWFLLMLMHFHW